jgi:hypothetical protein
MNRLLLALVALLTLALPARAQDAIDLHTVAIHNSPADIADWPATTRIAALTMSTPNGLAFVFPAQNTWPVYTPTGWTGGLQYTVWAVVQINGQWHTSGFIQMWAGRSGTGAPILTDFAKNWAYDGRWGAMQGHQPVVGEEMGFFVSAGDARGVRGVTSVRERSNVVTVRVPASDSGIFQFDAPPVVVSPPPVFQPPVTPAPLPIVLPPVAPAPLPSTDLSTFYNRLEALELRLSTLEQQQRADTEAIRSDIKSFRDAANNVLKVVAKYAGPLVAGIVAGLKLK